MFTFFESRQFFLPVISGAIYIRTTNVPDTLWYRILSTSLHPNQILRILHSPRHNCMPVPREWFHLTELLLCSERGCKTQLVTTTLQNDSPLLHQYKKIVKKSFLTGDAVVVLCNLVNGARL